MIRTQENTNFSKY